MNSLRALIARHPKGALIAGKASLLVGGILVVGAVFARAGLINLNADRQETGLPALHTLAEAFPDQPTWLVPEGPIGFGLSGLLVLGGMALAVLAEKTAKR